ncbi:hypothetical protein GOB93_18410 [Acetobacter musti]|uniref:Transposase n=1 Tax=Acetobacter musti TaxID=864732 RepID=A0ABX0JUT5_9PROT|nr:hypothetical protein [Acetobacter musti]NHN86584.1 hypothetical protein [Acetobacter musti]
MPYSQRTAERPEATTAPSQTFLKQTVAFPGIARYDGIRRAAPVCGHRDKGGARTHV